MIDIIKSLITLMVNFITGIYNIEIDLNPNWNVKFGTLVLAFISFIILLKVIFESIGIKKGDDD